MSELTDRVVPRDSIVLVTGANGFLGSHISDQFLRYCYRVRGTVRNLEKIAWLEKHFEEKYGAGRFELVMVADMAAEKAFHGVIKDKTALLLTLLNLFTKANRCLHCRSHSFSRVP